MREKGRVILLGLTMKELLTLTSEVLISLPELHIICVGFFFFFRVY